MTGTYWQWLGSLKSVDHDFECRSAFRQEPQQAESVLIRSMYHKSNQNLSQKPGRIFCFLTYFMFLRNVTLKLKRVRLEKISHMFIPRCAYDDQRKSEYTEEASGGNWILSWVPRKGENGSSAGRLGTRKCRLSSGNYMIAFSIIDSCSVLISLYLEHSETGGKPLTGHVIIAELFLVCYFPLQLSAIARALCCRLPY